MRYINNKDSAKRLDRIWNVEFTTILLVLFFQPISLFLTSTTIAKYAVEIGGTISQAGIVTGVYSIAALIIHPISGVLADRFDNRKLIIYSSIGTSAAICGYALSSNIMLLILFRFLHGISFGITVIVGSAMVMRCIPESRLTEGVGYVGLTSVLASAFAPALALELIEMISFRFLFFIAAAMPLLCVVIFVLMGIQDNRTVKVTSGKIKISDIFDARIMFFGLANALFSFGNGICSAYLALMAEERAIANISMFFVTGSVSLLLIKPIAGKITDKIGYNIVIVVSFVVIGLSMLLLANAHSLAMIVAAAVCRSIGQGAGPTALQAICVRKVGIDKSGVANSTFYLGGDIGNGLGPMIGGEIAESNGYDTMFSASGVVAFVGSILFAAYQWRAGKPGKKNRADIG